MLPAPAQEITLKSVEQEEGELFSSYGHMDESNSTKKTMNGLI